MSKVTVENTTDAAIYLPLGKPNDPITAIIPRAVRAKVKIEKTGDDKMVTTNGSAIVDSDDLAELRGRNKVVARYFADGKLKEVGSGPPPSPPTQSGSKGK
jgi:hypothetical protein